MLEAGIKKEQIFTYDVVSDFHKEMNNIGISFKQQDTLLALYPNSYNQFDFIVGNPPYLNKSSTYVRKNKQKLRKIYGKINAHETYAMFIVNSVWRLKEGGKLGFITSDSFLTLNTHKKLRSFILNNCKINEILLSPSNLFSDQKVSTSPVIIILTKLSGLKNKPKRDSNVMRIIPRVNSEDDYNTPKKVNEIQQKKYNSLPFKIFFTNIENEILELFERAPKLKEYVKGFIGMHTHNNRKYIAAIENTELAKIFKKKNEKISDIKKKFKIIQESDLTSGKWKPYLKRGGSDQYFRPILEGLDWREESIEIYDIPKKIPFEKEGVVISGISTRLAVRYMPKGCYWDSNKAIGAIIINKNLSIEYLLGLLNSSLYNYLAKGIINNTNSIQLSGIHALPLILPDKDTKEKIELLVKKILSNQMQNLDYNFIEEQKRIDDIIYNFYGKKFNFPHELKKKLDNYYSIY